MKVKGRNLLIPLNGPIKRGIFTRFARLPPPDDDGSARTTQNGPEFGARPVGEGAVRCVGGRRA
jgi:hypothetical protein